MIHVNGYYAICHSVWSCHWLYYITTLGVDGVEGGHFVVISIAADLSVPDSSNAFRHSVSDSDIQHSISAIHADAVLMLCRL